MAPLAELVRPGGLELRPAERIGVLGREGVGDGAGRPFEAAQRRLPARPLARRRHGEKPRGPADHDVAHVGKRLADKRDAPDPRLLRARVAGDHVADPFGPGAGLAGAASAEEEPGCPRRVAPRRRALPRPAQFPQPEHALDLSPAQRREKRRLLLLGRAVPRQDVGEAHPAARRGCGLDPVRHGRSSCA